MADLRWLRLATLLFVGLLLQGISGENLKRFDAILHFQELNHEALKQTPHKTETFLDIHEEILADKLKTIFSDPNLNVKFFDVIESGEELNQHTISVRAVITTSVVKDRDEFVETFEKQIPQNPGLYLFYLGELNQDETVDHSGLHAFHKKYSSKAPGECLNRGIMLPNATCVCQPYYSGDDCSIQTCLNSGIISQNFRCSCPPGFIGRHCEQLACMAAYNSEFDFRSRSFVLVLNTKKGSSFFLSRAIQVINQVIPPRAGYYANFILSVYYQDVGTGPYFSHTYFSTNYNDFLTLLNNQIQIHAGSDTQPTLSAINRALLTNNAIVPRSDVYVFTNSLLSDFSTDNPYMESSTTAEAALTRTLLNWGHSVYTILAQNFDSFFNDTDPSAFTGFTNIAAISNGEFIYIGNTTSMAGTIFQNLFKLNFIPETLAVRRGFDCSTPTTFTVNAGPYDSGLFLYTTGPGITVTNGGTPVTSNMTAGNFQIFVIGFNITTANLAVQGSGSGCSYRVFTSSSESVVLAYSKNYQLVDVSSNYPAASIPTSPVARILSLGTQLSLTFSAVSLSDPTSVIFNGGGTTPDNTNSRADCNFPLQFTQWPGCTPGVFAALLQYTENDNPKITTTRVRPSVCFQPITRDPTNVPLNCNGGTPLSNNTCSCRPYHSGQYCEIVNCQNGGSVNLFPGNGRPSCFCVEGYSGDYCEQMICTTIPGRPDTSKKTVNIVFQSTASVSYYKDQIISGTNAIGNGADSAQMFDGFTLTYFSNASIGEPTVQTQMFSNITGLINAITGTPSAFADDLQPQNVLSGLNSSLYASVAHPWQQVLFLIVDSPAGDQDLLNQVLDTAINMATSINVIVVKPYGNEGDATITCMDDTSLYQTLADSTGGVFINLCNNVNVIGDYMTSYGGILYNFQPTLRQTVNCSSAVTMEIEANDGIQTRYVIFISNTMNEYSFAFLDPSGNAFNSVTSTMVTAGYIYVANPLNARGNYSVSISPSGNIPGGLQCLLIIAEPAGQTILAGFAPNPSYDYTTLAAQFDQPRHPTIFMSTQLQSPPTVAISISGAKINYNSIAVARDPVTCQFDYYFNDVFSCPTAGEPISINVRITTNDSVSFNRALQSVCQGPQIGQCLNGGSVSLDLPFICTCPPTFIGQFCEIPVCYNGGSIVQSQCQCPPGFVGQFCELIQCTQWDYMATHNTNAFAYDTIAFVINTNIVSLLANNYLSTGIADFVNNINVKDHPKQFILTTFDDANVNKVISTTDPRKFISVFQNTVTKSTGSNDLNVNVKTVDAIYETIKLVTYKPAIFFVFSSTQPSSSSNMFVVNALLGRGGIQVNHILTGQTQLPTNESSYYYLVQTAIPTGGRILPLDAGQVTNLITYYLPPVIFENVIIEDQNFRNCLNEKWVYFPVENRAKWVTVTAIGNGVNRNNYVEIYDAGGQKITNFDDFIVVNSQGMVSYRFPATSTGNFAGYWKMSIETIGPNPCKVQITGSTPIQTAIGFTVNENDDFPHEIANTGTDSHNKFNRTRYVAVEVTNSLYQQYDVFPEYIKLTLYSDVEIGSGSVVLASPFQPRDRSGCAYQYITSQFNIPPNGANNLLPYKAQINGQDEKGQSFQRISWFMPQKPACGMKGTIDSNGYCVCPTGYTGDDCTIPICQNGGTADVAVCQCLSGFYGDFCEKRVLSSNSTTTTSATTTSKTTTMTSGTSTMTSGTSGTSTMTSRTSTMTSGTSTTISGTSGTSTMTSGTSTMTSGTSKMTSGTSTTTSGTSTMTTTTGAAPLPPTTIPNCHYTSQNFIFSFFIDGTTYPAQSNIVNKFLEAIASTPNFGGALRTAYVYNTATGVNNISNAINFTEIVSTYNAQGDASMGVSTVSLLPSFTHYQSDGPHPSEDTTIAPTIIMVTSSNIVDLNQVTSIINGLRQGRTAYIMSITLTSGAAEQLFGVEFDLAIDLTFATANSSTDAANSIINMVCNVNNNN